MDQNKFSNPPYYMPKDDSEIECLHAIRAALGIDGYIDHLRGCIIKYTWRAIHKGDEYGDFKKVEVYTNLLLEEIRDTPPNSTCDVCEELEEEESIPVEEGPSKLSKIFTKAG